VEAKEEVRQEWLDPQSEGALVAACPAAGKTIYGCEMATVAREEFDSEIALIVSPTVPVKEDWHETSELFGLGSIHNVPNETLRERLTFRESLIGDREVICVTYSQLANESELFAEMLRRHRGLLIADEPHHADENETFGRALNLVAEGASLRLALTGTPFNTRGTPLSMIKSVEEIDEEGFHVRRAIPTYSYSYGEAITDQVCRPVEFITVMGRGEVEYRSLLNNNTWLRVTDLAARRKTDRLGPLLDPDGAFMMEMLETGIKALVDLREQDDRAAMMVVVGSKEEGERVARVLQAMQTGNPAWSRFSVEEIYHDTPDAHRRIRQFRNGPGDIVIAVRMIYEGVNIPRLRVGVYATGVLTRLFFIQLVGRFLRSEARLDAYQFAKVVIPAHTLLLQWAREIEQMVAGAKIPDEGENGSGGVGDAFEMIGRGSQVTGMGAILRGEAEDDIGIARDFFARVPSAVGRVPDFLATTIERAYRDQAAASDATRGARSMHSRKPDPRAVNQRLVASIVRQLPHHGGEPDETDYARVNGAANRHVGIRRLDRLTTDDVLERRAAFLRTWLAALYRGEPFNEAP